MQRSICRVLGACGLIFTFTAVAQTAGGGGAAGGGAAGGGGGAASGGTAFATGGGARVGTTAPATATTGATAGTANAGGRATVPGTAAQGQNVSTIPGQNVSVVPPTIGAQGQPGAATPATAGTTISAPNTAGISPTTAPGGTVGTGIPGTTGAAGAGGAGIGSRSMVALNSLPAPVQAQIAAQIPAGAQVGGIIAEQTPQGTMYRAQVLQNGIVSEMALSGLPGTALAGTVGNNVGANAGFNSGAGLNSGGLAGGFVTGAPYGFEQLPVPVQTALAAQGAAGATNVTFTPAGNAGIFRTTVDGRPIEVRMSANGQILPVPARAIAASNTTTNALKIEDLPVAVRDAIRNTAEFAEVTRIRKSTTASGDVYDVTMRANDRLTMMQIAENGTIIKENHDLAAAVRTETNTIVTNEAPKLAWNSLPVAVRDSIEVQTRPDTIKTLALTNYLGKTAYVVDYVDKDALRNRLYLNKEGLVVDTQTNIFGVAMSGKPVVIDDLPAPARTTVQQQAENSAVTRIDLAMHGLTPVYVVTYQKNGEARQMVVSREGRRMDANVGAPAATVIGAEKGRSEAETKATEVNQ